MKWFKLVLLICLGIPLLGQHSVSTDSTNFEKRALDAFMRGMELESQERWEEAAKAYEEAAKADSTSPDIFLSLGKAYQQLDRKTAAERAYLKVIQLDSTYEEALEALVELNQGEPRRALPFLKRLYRLRSDDPRTVFQLVQVYHALKDTLQEANYLVVLWELDEERLAPLQRAEKLYLALRRWDKVLDIYHRLAKIFPNSLELLKRRVQLLITMGRYDTAVRLVDSLFAKNPDSEPLVLFKTELVNTMNGPLAAIRFLSKLAQKRSLSPEMQLKLGQLYFDSGNYERAIVVLKKLLENDPSRAQAVALMVWSYMNLRNSQGAWETLQAYLPAFPDNYYLHYLNAQLMRDLAIAKKDTSLQRQAFRAMEQAIKLNETDQQGLHLLALLADETGNYERAKRAYQTLIEQYPRDHLAKNNYAYLIAVHDSTKEALLFAAHLIQEALSVEPKRPAYLDTAGWIYFKLGHFTMAEKYLRASVKLDGNNAEVLGHLAQLLERLGKVKEAEQYFQKARALEARE